MTLRLTTNEWAAELGRHLRDLRLRRNIDQRNLAKQAAVALNVVNGRVLVRDGVLLPRDERLLAERHNALARHLVDG